MDNLHKNLSERHAWYAEWHKIPHINLLHFFFLIGVAAWTINAFNGSIGNVNANKLVGAVAESKDGPGLDYGPWFKISKWDDCSHLMNKGYIFEIQNAEGQSMFSECVAGVPKAPFDWHSDAVRFRLVKEPKPEHEDPFPGRQDPGERK